MSKNKTPKPPAEDTEQTVHESVVVKPYRTNTIIDENSIKELGLLIINDHVDIMTGCDYLRLDPAKVIKLQREGSLEDSEGLPRYVYDVLRSAQAQSQIVLVRRWLGDDALKSSASEKFLAVTADRYRQKHALHVTYEVTAILDIVEHYTTPEQFTNIVAAVSRLDGEETIRLLDARSGLV
jgi:hypothetical protein